MIEIPEATRFPLKKNDIVVVEVEVGNLPNNKALDMMVSMQKHIKMAFPK